MPSIGEFLLLARKTSILMSFFGPTYWLLRNREKLGIEDMWSMYEESEKKHLPYLKKDYEN